MCVRVSVCVLRSVFQFEFFSISVNLCNYIPTEGGIKPIFIYWGDEYDSPLLYRLHICRQTHINLRPWWRCSEGCVIKHCYMRKWINLLSANVPSGYGWWQAMLGSGWFSWQCWSHKTWKDSVHGEQNQSIICQIPRMMPLFHFFSPALSVILMERGYSQGDMTEHWKSHGKDKTKALTADSSVSLHVCFDMWVHGLI